MLATVDPSTKGLIDEVPLHCRPRPHRLPPQTSAPSAKDQRALRRRRGDRLQGTGDPGRLPDPTEGIEVVIEDSDTACLEDLLQDTEAPPAIRLANAVILEAIRLGASDVHIQPRTKSVVVRYPHRRRTQRQDPDSPPPASVAGVPPQDHGGTRHLPTPPAPGRADRNQDPDAHGGPAHPPAHHQWRKVVLRILDRNSPSTAWTASVFPR